MRVRGRGRVRVGVRVGVRVRVRVEERDDACARVHMCAGEVGELLATN